MSKRKRQIFQDIFIVVVSVIVAIIAAKTGIISDIVLSLSGIAVVGIFVAGMFFTSVFTTAPAIVLLGGFALQNDLWVVVLVGALGAAMGDYFIFRFVRDRAADDVEYLLKVTHEERWLTIFNKRIFRWFIPFIGALIIASPFPDELGIAMLGLSKTKSRNFLAISYIFNALGIVAIGIVARSVVF